MAEAGTIDSLQIEIEASSKSAVTQVNNLAKALKNLKSAVNGGLNIGNFKKELGKLGNNEYAKIDKLAKALQGLKNVKLDEKIGNSMLKIADACDLIEQQHIDKLTKFGAALQTLKSISTKGYDKLPASILNISAAVDSITDDSIARLSRLTIALSRLRGVDLSGLGTVLRAQNAAHKQPIGGKGTSSPANSGKNDVNGESGEDELTQRVRQAAKPTSAIGSAMKSMLQTLANDLKNVASSAINAAKAIGGKFLSAIKSVTSAAIGFGKNILTAPFQAMASKVKTLTDRMHGLISSFKRIMFYRVIRAVIKEIGEAIKEGTENAYWYSKKFGVATEYISQAYDDYASASFKMKNQVGAAWSTLYAQLVPIIISIISVVTKGVEAVTQFFAVLGGRSTFLKARDYAKDWATETEKGNKAAKEWKNQLMGFDVINRLEKQDDNDNDNDLDSTDFGDLFEEVPINPLIEDFANRLKDAWESQDWQRLGETIGGTINVIFPSESQWKEWGEKLGNAINGLIQTVYHALKTMDFGEFGRRMAEGLNSALEQIDFEYLGRTLVRGITSALDFLIGFLGGLRWDLVGKSIGDLLRGALDEATEWLLSYDWMKIGRSIRDNLARLIDGFDVATFAQKLGHFISTAANSAADFIIGLDFSKTIGIIKDALVTFFDNFPMEEVKQSISRLWTVLKTQWVLMMADFGTWLRTTDWKQKAEDFTASLLKLVGELVKVANAIPFGDVINAISEAFQGVLDAGTKWLSEHDWIEAGEEFRKKLEKIFDDINIEDLSNSIGKFLYRFNISVADSFHGLDVGQVAADIGDWLARAIEGIDVGKLMVSLTYMLTTLLANLPSIIMGILEGELRISAASFRSLGMPVIADFIEGMADKVENERTTIQQGVVDPVVQNIRECMNSGNENSALGEVGKEAANDFLNSMSTTISGGFEGSHSSGTFESVGERIVEQTESGITRRLPLMHSRIKSGVSEAVDEFAIEFGRIPEVSERELSNASSSVNTHLQEMSDAVNRTDLSNGITESFSGIYQAANESFGNVEKVVTDATDTIKTNSVNDTEQLHSNLSYLYSEIEGVSKRTFGSMETEIPSMMQSIVQKVYAGIQEITRYFQQFETDISNAVRNIQNAMDFEWSIPKPKIPHINVWYDYAYNGDGTSVQFPRFDVQWYAKGGIVNAATLIGAGEVGKEAIIPLERNTEWIGKVASEMNRQSEQSSNDGDMAADLEEANGVVVNAIMAATNQIIRAMQTNERGEPDMDSFVRAISKIQRQQARASGAY